MKRTLLLLAICVLMAAPLFAKTEVDVWGYDPATGAFTAFGIGDREALARCWSSQYVSGACNKAKWEIDVYIHASVAQWIDWWMTGSWWNWYVRKPGCYVADCITAHVASNGDVGVTYSGFENLFTLEPLNNVADQYIEIEYGLGGMLPGDVDFIPATLLNNEEDLLDETLLNFDLHEGVEWKLWNRICVSKCNTACEYEDRAMITLTLLEQKPWIDEDDGYFKKDFNGPIIVGK